ncbi:MAG: endonuclease/exonuclease/phosphatase family protein [Fibrobacteres bacterium]|nr:endonuclease/exonuclease/phosphatase family protein [Fibrobacterota bacterium]
MTRLKMATWNCNGKFREKFHLISAHNPDVWLIQECENPEEIPDSFSEYHKICSNYIWKGDKKHKGIAIFAKPEYSLAEIKLNQTYRDRELKWFLPARINDSFNLMCVWNHKNNCNSFGYIGQFWLLMENNRQAFEDFLIAGDFNSNSIWDEWDRWWNHSDCVRELSELGIASVYHGLRNETQGKESSPTLYLQRNKNKPYHIDYIFANSNYIPNSHLNVGHMDEWLHHSDHMPLFWEFDLPKRNQIR